MSTKLLLIIMGILIAVLTATFIITGIINRKRQGKITAAKTKGRSLKGIFWLYKFFSSAPIIKRYYKKIRVYLEINFPADEMSIRRKATVTMLRFFLIIIALIVIIVIMAKGDWFFIFMGVFLTYFLFTYLLTTFQERLDNKLLNQLGDFITNIRHHYSAQGNVEDAIYDTLDETPYEMGLHANIIYRILNSINTEAEVDKYTDIAPNKFILTFVAICSTIKEYGDKKLEDGQSLFLTNINYLKEEINVEILKRKKISFLFSGLIALALLPLLFLKAIEAWGTSNIPEMSTFYTGTAGTIMMAVIFAITVLIYQLISNLKDGNVQKEGEHKIINRILSIAPINKFVTNIINHKYTKYIKIDDCLKMTGDNIGVKGFLIKRVIYGILTVILVTVVIFTAQWRARENVLTDFSETFESSIVPNEEYRETMREAAEDYTRLCKNTKASPELKNFVIKEITDKYKIEPKFATEVADEILKRAEEYQDIYYYWYFVLINVLGFVMGYFIPYLILRYQLSIVQMDMEDEVIQYQTIVLILMHVDGIMIDTVLEWMERFSFCFKATIQECIINLEYSTQKSLMKMKNQESYPPFKRFVDNLLMVDDEDILTAFSEIETDREYYKEKRKQDNEIIATKKSEIGKIIAFIPLIVALLGYLIVPFGMYAFEMISSIGMFTG